MRFRHVQIEALAYELPLETVSTTAIELHLASVYERLRIPRGQLEMLTGIAERRYWPRGVVLSERAAAAGRSALQAAGRSAATLEAVVYAGVCRDYAEPATACAVAAELGVSAHTQLYDVSNACIGVLSAMVDLAGRIELGFIENALIVSCESARSINEDMAARLLEHPDDRALFNETLATFTGGSGAAAVLLSRLPSPAFRKGPRLLGAVQKNDCARHDLCQWGFRREGRTYEQFMRTDAVQVLRHGVALGRATWNDFLVEMEWRQGDVTRAISHQIGKAHRQHMLDALGLAPTQDFPTFPFLGNIGSVSVPLTAALAAERGLLNSGDRVGLLGIGSGLNCLMVGLEW